MSDEILENLMKSSLQLIVEGRDKFLNTNDYDKKQQSYTKMKKGCQELLIYLRKEKDENLIKLVSSQLRRYVLQLTQFSSEIKQNPQIDEVEILSVQKQELLYTQDTQNDIQIVNEQYGQYVQIQNFDQNQKIQLIGLETQRQSLQERIALPILFPNLFEGKRKLQTQTLLFGPKGTGKTQLINFIASECQALLFVVNVSRINEAVDKINSQELKNQIDQLTKNKPFIILLKNLEDFTNKEQLFNFFEKCSLQRLIDNSKLAQNVIGSSSQPWKIHYSIRRSFENRIETSLMNQDERLQYLNYLMLQNNQVKLEQDQLVEISKITNKFTGLDLKNLFESAINIYCANQQKRKDETFLDSFSIVLKSFQSSVSDNELLQFKQWRNEFCI